MKPRVRAWVGEGGPWAALSWICLALAVSEVFVFLSKRLALRDVDLWFFFSSDTVQYGLLYKDLFDLGFSFSGWNISHAPEYTQMVWALLMRALTPTLAAGHVLEALTQPVLLAIALQFLASRMLGRRTLVGPLIASCVLWLITRGPGLDLFAFIWSNRHGFAAITAVIGLALYLRALGTGRVVALACLTAVGALCDLLFLVWFVVPVLATAFVVALRSRAVVWRPIIATTVGAIAGVLAFWLVTPIITVGEKVTIDWTRMAGSLGRLADDAGGGAGTRATAVLLAVGALIAGIGVFRGRREEIRFAALFSGLLSLATIGAIVATAAPFREAGYTRYLLAPELAAVASIVLALGSSERRERTLLGAAIVLTLAALERKPPSVPSATGHYPPLVQCIDGVARRHGLQFGVADYWLSKYVTALSREDLSVVSVTPRLDPFVRFSNLEWFLGGVGARKHDKPVYTFAILGSMKPDDPGVAPQALAAFGPAAAVETCLGYEIRVLPQGADRAIRSRFADNPRIQEHYARRGLPLPRP